MERAQPEQEDIDVDAFSLSDVWNFFLVVGLIMPNQLNLIISAFGFDSSSNWSWRMKRTLHTLATSMRICVRSAPRLCVNVDKPRVWSTLPPCLFHLFDIW
jgi:hypothetical protein